VDPVSRRDFWRILYQLLREKVTIFVSTAYLDEAERCNRLALVHHGGLLACGTPDEVKRLMRHTILEVRTGEPRRAAEILRRQWPTETVGLFGDRIHVVSRTPDTAAGRVEEVLRAAGVPPESVRVTRPSLEDVFVSALGQEREEARSPLPRADAARPGEGQGEGELKSNLPSNAPSPPAPLPKGEGRAGTPSDTKAVVVENLERRFGSFVAVNRISFQVHRGEIYGFLGPNGAGKSTTIRMLCGLLTPSGGRGSVAGFDLASQPEQIKANVGYMSQRFSLYMDLTVEENIDFYSGIYRIPRAQKQDRKDWVIAMAGLQQHRRRPTSILSGGWKQRLALGCAILHRPPIVFLDEPTSGVDPISRRQFWELIYEMAGEGVTVFVTTHYMDEAEYCDRLGLIYRGELIAQGTPESLKREAMQEDVLEVVCQRPEEAMAALEGLAGVREPALFGNTLHILAADAGQAAAEVRRRLAERRFVVERIEPIPPSLEDVFVSLIEARDRAERPEQEVAR
jgi:ABC-2 type transport system ATP-binding protein